MELSLGARPWIYFSFGPFIGHICMTVYSIIHSSLVYSSNQDTIPDLLAGFFLFIFFAYMIGTIPAFLTGLITDITSKILRHYFRSTIFRLIFSGLIGYLMTTGTLILLIFSTNEMDVFYKTDPLSGIAISVYGVIAAVICESIHIKMGSPNKIE